MNRSGLIASVRAKIDEVSTANEILIDVSFGEGKSIATLIDELLNECALEVLSVAPVHRLTLEKSETAGTAIDEYSGEIKLAATFLRFVSLKMADFTRSITQLTLEGSDIAKRQNNQFYRATKDRPIGVLVTKNDGVYVRYYGVENSHTSNGLLFIKKDVAENVPEICQNALCWLCASKVLAVTGDLNGSKGAYEYFTKAIV